MSLEILQKLIASNAILLAVMVLVNMNFENKITKPLSFWCCVVSVLTLMILCIAYVWSK